MKFPLKIFLLPKTFFQPGLRWYKKKGGVCAKENITAYFTALQLYLQGVCFASPKVLFGKTLVVASNELASNYLVFFSLSQVLYILVVPFLLLF